MNIQHPLKKINSLISIRSIAGDINFDFFPSGVHPAFEEDAVEPFEFVELGLGEVLSYQEPYFGGQVRECCHIQLTSADRLFYFYFYRSLNIEYTSLRHVWPWPKDSP